MKTIFLIIPLSIFFFFDSFSQATITMLSQNSLGGTLDEFSPSIAKTKSGGYVIASWSESTDKDLPGNIGSYDFWVTKVNDTGTVVWSKNFGGSSRDQSSQIIALKNGGYIVVGLTLSTDSNVKNNNGVQDAWMIKVSESGSLLWAKCYGGPLEESFNSVVELDGGHLMAIGYTSSTTGQVSGNHGAKDLWVVKADSMGNLLWQKCYGGTSDELGYSACLSSKANTIIIGGIANSSNGDLTANKGGSDGWILKIDTAGALLNQINTGGTMDDLILSVAPKADGGCLIAGYSQSSSGDVPSNKGSNDVWFARFGSTLSHIWSKSVGGTLSDYASGIAELSNGRILVAGAAQSNDNDFSGNKGAFDMMVLITDSNGNTLGNKLYGGNFSEYSTTLVLDNDTCFTLVCNAASSNGDVVFNNGGNDIWFVKMKTNALPSGGPVGFNTTQPNYRVYPNPFGSGLNINLPAYGNYYILNSSGQRVCTYNPENANPINTTNWPSGLYFLVDEMGTAIKLVKQ